MSNQTEVKVPDIGDFEKVPVIEVLVAQGDSIEEEQSLVTLESDKATMEVPSSVSGTLVALKVKEGDQVSQGDVIAVVDSAEADTSEDHAAEDDAASESDDAGESGEDAQASERTSPESTNQDPAEQVEDQAGRHREESERAKNEPYKSERESLGHPNDGATADSETTQEQLPAPPVPFAEMGRDPSSIPHASPAVRKLAREMGVDLANVNGSGARGRITEEDLKRHVKDTLKSGAVVGGGAGAAASGTGMTVAPPPAIDFSKFGDVDEKPLSRIQKLSGPNLHRNWVTIPHVTQFDEADITEMEAFRKASKAEAEQAGVKMTPLVFLVKAVVAALKQFPKFNTSLGNSGESLVWKNYFHVGVAVDTPNGLMVPVIRDADGKSLLELARDLSELSGKAREGKLSREEMQGGSMTISSLGGIGGTAFTPIINAPEVAILGVSRAEMKPKWTGETFEPRLTLPLSLSYDHRVIDGADAARFAKYLTHVLGDVRRLML